MPDVGVWIDGECVGVVRDDGRPSIAWPIAATKSIILGTTGTVHEAFDFQVASCRREEYCSRRRGGSWATAAVFIDGERSKVAIVTGIAALYTVYGLADG